MTSPDIREFQVEMVPGENNQIVPIQGMCATATSAADEPRALCIIRDLSRFERIGEKNGADKIAINLPASTTAEQLLITVSEKFLYDPNTFELVFQRKGEITLIVSIHEMNDETLEELGFQCGDGNRNSLIIGNKNGMPPKKIEATRTTFSADKMELQSLDTKMFRPYHRKARLNALESGDSTSTTYVPPPAPPPYTSAESTEYGSSYNQGSNRHDTGFVGLVNQAMTCYLNSLLQTLFMTPEFRNTLYRWEFDGTEEEGTKSIPFQLQKLFLQLQVSKKPAVGTTELTTSFGWDSSEAWQQHDVQELCRVMFDALEQKFKNTQQADLISRLYEGKLKDYVKCLECLYESARVDTFLDVPLVVRPFGSSQAYASVEEAMQAFVTPETLQGTNQYFCEHCNKKCDAHKGLKFTKFPYLLTLQLKRFDFDYGTMHRIKLNDRVSFPEILNLNGFVKTENSLEGSEDGDTTDSGSALDEDSVSFAAGYKTGSSLSPEATSDSIDLGEVDEGIEVDPQGSPVENCNDMSITSRPFKKSTEKGPYMYELFSIMVHSGSANGGHYYAYIKSFKEGEWYCFNDAQVTRITLDDIQKTYGGGPSRGYYSSAYSSSTNAYMLMYRQIDREKNVEILVPEGFPEHIKVLLQCMQAQEERERQQREIDRSMCKIKLFCQHPVHRRMSEMKLKIHKDDTLATATAVAHKIMGLEGVVPLECCRLIKYDDFLDSLECSFECDGDPMGELLGGVKSSYKFDLLLEIRKPTEQFQEYKPGGTTIKVHVIDLEQEEVAAQPITIRSNPTVTVDELRSQIAQSLGVSGEKMRIILETYSNETKLLDVPSNILESEGFKRSNKVFVEFNDATDADKPYSSSKLFKVLDRYAHTILLHVALPKVDKGILERLRIHDNDIDEGKDESSSSEEEVESASDFGQVRAIKSCTRNQSYAKNYSDVEWDSRPWTQDHGLKKCIALVSDLTTRNSLNRRCIELDDGRKIPLDDECIRRDEKRQFEEEYTVSCNSQKLSKQKFMFKSSGCSKEYQKQKTEDFFLDYDEGLGDSEIGDSSSTNGGGHHQLGQATHSDQSEDSSLTDSERTLIGDELSPRNNSPDIIGTEIEQDLEPLHQVSGIEVSKPECDSGLTSSDGSSYLLRDSQESCRNMSSPEENTKDASSCVHAVCTNSSTSQPVVAIENVKYYFRAWPYTDCETGEKMLRVYVDKRITLADVKKELEPHIGVEAECFKIYRVYSNNQEVECTRLVDNLMTYGDDSKLTVKLGRPLRKGEYKVQIHQLCVNESEPVKHLIDWVLLKGMTVLKAKKEILPEIKERCGLDIPLNRCRLRKKSWKNPGSILLDHQRFDKDITITTHYHYEIFLEVLPDAEPVTDISQTALLTRRWYPSKCLLDPFKELVLENMTMPILFDKLSEISDIPVDHIEIAKGQGSFPCEVSLLTIHKELEWHKQPSSNTFHTICIGDDGHVLFYRDTREQLKKLTEEEKREICNKENARSNKSHKTTYSPRKEKALKIYTLDDTPSSNTSQNSRTNISETSQTTVPDPE